MTGRAKREDDQRKRGPGEKSAKLLPGWLDLDLAPPPAHRHCLLLLLLLLVLVLVVQERENMTPGTIDPGAR